IGIGTSGCGKPIVKSAERDTLAIPPPATKYGVSAVAVVGISTRTVFVNITTRPFVFVNPVPAYTIEDGTEAALCTSTGLPVLAGKGDLSVGTTVASSSMPTIRVKR